MVRGLDHVVVAVNDHQAAGRAFEELGFTVTPENRHAWGTANRLVQLDGFFIELLSVVEPEKIVEASPGVFSFGAFNRDFLEKRQGASMLVLDSSGAEQDRSDFQKAGLTLFEPFSFERIANLPDGSTAKVAFDLTFAENPLSPEIGYFACCNRYPDSFWKPDFQKHRNGATSVRAVYLLAEDPSDHHEFLGGFTGQREMRATSLGLEIATSRGKIHVVTPHAYESLLGPDALAGARGSLPRIAALDVACKGLEQRRTVPADRLSGLTLILSPAN
ncbi:VOC family protein [Roseibium sp. AS2]|uniref:VOC family protein n=1 Tax=Roseibium sp. AS2 TaxID=3135781 RepID=UPI003173C047